MPASRLAPFLILALASARAEELPTQTSEAGAPKAFTLTATVRIEPKDSKSAVVIEAATDLPDQAILQCHLYVTFAGVTGQERVNFIDGRSGMVAKGKAEIRMGPYAMVPGTYRVEVQVDPHRQYPQVLKALEGIQDPIHQRVDFKTGTDEEIASEREIGRPMILHSAEAVQKLTAELLGHSRDLQGPFEPGDWEGPWKDRVTRLRHRLTVVPGRVVGQNQVSRPLCERYDEAEAALFDCARALIKGYDSVSGKPAAAAEEGDPPPWSEAVTADSLKALESRALDALALDYRQDVAMRLEGALRNARQTYQQAAEEKEAPAPKEGEGEAPPRGPSARELWAVHSPLWISECKDLREEVGLLTDPNSPSPFVKEMAKRLTGVAQDAAALSAQVETAVQGFGAALTKGMAPGEATAKAIDDFYARYAAYLLTTLAGAAP